MDDLPPERIYFTKAKRALEYIKYAGFDIKEADDDYEYICADIATKNIRAVWEEYKEIAKGDGFNADEFEYSHVGAIHFKKLWQAIKADGIKAGWIKE